jgi:hypothetical protein
MLLFNDDAYRFKLLRDVDDAVVQNFWRKFDSLSASRKEDLSYPVEYRLRLFYRNPLMHLMTCQPQAFDFAELIRQRKIVLVSLGADERKIPAREQQLLGAMLVSQIQMASMASLKHVTPFYLYIDEVQNFVTSSLAKIFEEARKYKLYLTVANQYLDQLKGKTLDSIMGTVGTTAVFQVGLSDAKVLSPYLAPEFGNADLVNISKYHAAIKSRYRGDTMSAFSIATRPEPGDVSSAGAKAREQMIRERSIHNYTPRSRKEVQAWLDERYGVRPGKTKETEVKPKDDALDWFVD